MALILDTSAVIGWVERRNQNVIEALAATERLPVISIVTLGELFQGVESARYANDAAALTIRQRTLSLAQRRLPRVGVDESDAKMFGRLSAALSRTVSHNGRWIATVAIRVKRTLVTEDAQLAAALGRCGIDIPIIVC
ncbi:type II toxin-antitoxin system VapC family toxin [Mycobacterium sp.]|uniref:type II toxin-antitoxin system VapC family toxin n=1 Tax=Mycobacterium sp. TaxID=1785 RepID=UPI002D1D1C68|nr:type II toxin-antitoxin system VapC family toxin [Mycobacterium sp.]HTQ21063.1 type II toxin-antitoxin system VapC family toxin [Mycobacterium sp.]